MSVEAVNEALGVEVGPLDQCFRLQLHLQM